MKKILVIDGNSIINRAFYGIRLLTTKSGKFTNAVYGTVNIISRQIEAIKPDYAAVAFDIKHPTFRHEMYPEYKAGRHATPEELKSQFPDAMECLSLMGLHVMELPGWEADDIHGTIAKMAHLDGDTEAYVLSGDRDLLQLIDDKVTVLLATNQDTLVMKEPQFVEKYGVLPSQFVDMKALMGDSSDNIPGVAGVGEKTAQSLIANFGTLEGIYNNIEDKRISKGVREKLLRDRDNAFMSRTLAKIDTAAPVGVTLDDIKYEGINKAGLYKKFTELELHSLISRFHLESVDEVTECKENITSEEAVQYTCISADELVKFNTGAASIEFLGENALYISTEGKNLVYRGDVSDILPFFLDRELITYGAKAIWHRLDKAGIDTDRLNFFDLELCEYTINPGGGSAGVGSMCASFLGQTPPANSPAAHLFSDLKSALVKRIEEDGLSEILYGLEIPLMPVLAETEKNGFKINRRGIDEFGMALEQLANELAESIYNAAGERFNINSPKQLGEILFEKLGLENPLKKKSKNGYSTDAETLEAMREQAAIIDDILEYRQVTKLRGTYTTALTNVADENDRIHTEFKQTLTATGRLSSAEPNLQNIPIKTKMGRELRRFFIADEGNVLVDADYSQIELRLLAHISGDYNMCEAFKDGEDIHRKTAAAVFGMPEEYVTEDMRKRAKAVNFGIVYGISAFSLSQDIGVTVAEAKDYMERYFATYTGVKEYMDQIVETARQQEYVETLLHRRRALPELKSSNFNLRAFGERVALNMPIQGTAADIIKLAMVRVHRRLKEEKLCARLIMQVHDELIVECPLAEQQQVERLLAEEMEGVMALSVPLLAEAHSGRNWLEAKG